MENWVQCYLNMEIYPFLRDESVMKENALVSLWSAYDYVMSNSLSNHWSLQISRMWDKTE